MTDLTDRMRTCAARIVAVASKDDIVYNDAADLLIEASNILEAAPAPWGEPMEIIPPVAPPSSIEFGMGRATWLAPGDTLPKANPYRSTNTCPNCDSRASKTVRRVENKLMLVCPVCAETWEFKR